MKKSKIIERFTERAKKSLLAASYEAKKMGSSVIDTEHLLLGVLVDEEGAAARILNNFKIDFNKIREIVIGSSDPRMVSNEQGVFSEASQEALSNAVLQAYLWGNSYVGTEHILFGLAKTTSGLACHILRSYGITSDIVKEKIGVKENFDNRSDTKVNKTPLLNSYSRDLTQMATSGKLDPVVGRDNEISRCLQILMRRTKNNPVLLGEAGVGKTAIVEGLAQKIVSKEVPEKFFNTRLVNLDLNALVAGTRFRGDFEERLVGIIDEIKDAQNIILFIDEIQTIVGAGGAGGALDAANILKPALARGELRCIGASTSEEYAEYIEDDKALERRFQPIFVEEPELETAYKILSVIKSRYENFHQIRIKNSALKRATQLAKRFLTERHLPDSAIDIIDEAASKKALSSYSFSHPEMAKIVEDLSLVREEKEIRVKEGDYDEAVSLRDKEKELERNLSRFLTKNKDIETVDMVTEKDIEEVVSTMTGIPLEDLSIDEAKKLINLEKEMSEEVIGQEEALKVIATALRRSRVGLTDQQKPIGSFLFLGTSGVGKTLVAKTLAKILFDDAEALIRFDMSEFMEKHTVSRLLGAPPGYIGYEEGGELTEKLRRKPYSVILFDEIEKAHPEVWNSLLSVLDYGKLVDGKGRGVSFRNTIIIMTSNVGTEMLKKQVSVGFRVGLNQEGQRYTFEDVKMKLMEDLGNNFKAEFLNRIDSVVVFKPLGIKEAERIAKLIVQDIQNRLKEKRIKLTLSEKILAEIVKRGFTLENGARPMKRACVELLEEPLAVALLEGRMKEGDQVFVDLLKDQTVFKIKSTSKSKES